jgi:hypothetical protein
MNAYSLLFVVLTAAALAVVPRKWAALPLLVGACYATMDQALELGALHFTASRMLIAVGVLRVMLRGEWPAGGMNTLDRLMSAWAAWALLSTLFHADPGAALVNRLGLVYNACGIYLLVRAFCRSLDDAVDLCGAAAILLLPLAAGMLIESLTRYNLFSILTDNPLIPEIRDGRVRAQGPFAHSILAGSAGACSLPLMLPLWRTRRKTAVLGVAACSIMVMTSGSSGPILSAAAALFALGFWRFRRHARLMRRLAVLGYLGLDLVMKAPAYYLISRLDLTGSSTSWHRSALIEAALNHLEEWWFAGTDFTRHWMPYGVSWSEKHADITNHYLRMGVDGGLPLMLLFIALLGAAFSFVGTTIARNPEAPLPSRLLAWSLGASLFAHAASFISVSYFDQTFVFLYLTLAAIGSVRAAAMPGVSRDAAAGKPITFAGGQGNAGACPS